MSGDDGSKAMQEYIMAVQAAHAAATGGGGVAGPDEWNCPGCGAVQSKRKLSCAKCGRPRPIAGLPQGPAPAALAANAATDSGAALGGPGFASLPSIGGATGSTLPALPGMPVLDNFAMPGMLASPNAFAGFGAADMASMTGATGAAPHMGQQLGPQFIPQQIGPQLPQQLGLQQLQIGPHQAHNPQTGPVFLGYDTADADDGGSSLAAQAALAAMRNASLSGEGGVLVNTNSIPVPMSQKPGDWVCKTCNDLQFARNATCRRCGEKRPTDGPRERADGKPWFAEPGDWVCSGCGDLQFKRNVVCRKCQTPRSRRAQAQKQEAKGDEKAPGARPQLGQLGPPTQKTGDWMCKGCGDLQFARNTVCRRCGSARPNDGVSGTPWFAEGGDWLCPGCGDLQFKRNNSCRKCGLARPKDDEGVTTVEQPIEPELSKEAEEMKEYFIALHAAQKAQKDDQELHQRTVRVNNPPPTISEDSMLQIFRGTFGGVVQCSTHTDGKSGKQFAKVVFDTKENAKKAIVAAGDTMEMTLLSDHKERYERGNRPRSRSRDRSN